LPDRNNATRFHPRKTLFVIRLAAWVGIGGGLLVVLAAFFALHIPSIRKAVIVEVVSRIEATTNFQVQIHSLQWRPFSTTVYLTEVKVESGGKQVLDCGKVRVKCRPSIKSPFIIVEEVYLEKPFLRLEKKADGKWLLPAPAGTGARQGGSQGENPFWSHLLLPKIQIVSGTIEATQQGNTVLHIKDISGSVSLGAAPGVEGPEIKLDFENTHAQKQVGE
jgi:hypothetical protein